MHLTLSFGVPSLLCLELLFTVFFSFKDCLTTGHIEGLQNLVDPGSISWTRNELDLEQASKASCIIALCGWMGRYTLVLGWDRAELGN